MLTPLGRTSSALSIEFFPDPTTPILSDSESQTPPKLKSLEREVDNAASTSFRLDAGNAIPNETRVLTTSSASLIPKVRTFSPENTVATTVCTSSDGSTDHLVTNCFASGKTRAYSPAVSPRTSLSSGKEALLSGEVISVDSLTLEPRQSLRKTSTPSLPPQRRQSQVSPRPSKSVGSSPALPRGRRLSRPQKINSYPNSPDISTNDEVNNHHEEAKDQQRAKWNTNTTKASQTGPRHYDKRNDKRTKSQKDVGDIGSKWWSSIGKEKGRRRASRSAKKIHEDEAQHQKARRSVADIFMEEYSTTMTKDVVESLVAEFDSAASDGKNLDQDEFMVLINHYVARSLGNHVKRRLYDLFKALKQDKRTMDGVSVVGYLKGIDKLLKGGVADAADFFFDLIDLNNDGRISKSEFIKVWRNVKMSKMPKDFLDKEKSFDEVLRAANAFEDMCHFGGRTEKNATIDRELYHKVLAMPKFAMWFEDMRDDLPITLVDRERQKAGTLTRNVRI